MENYRYKMCYGELQGKSHIPKNIPCQDKALCLFKNGVSVAVLSDGCGSAVYSHYGSDITTRVTAELLTEKFDELYAYDFNNEVEQNTYRKTIINNVITAQIAFINEHPEMFEKYKEDNIEKYKLYAEKNKEMNFFLKALDATLLFFAEKDGKYLMAIVGDGVVGAVVDDKLKIVLEEKKEGEVNGTYYPSTIYGLANVNGLDENEILKRYSHPAFQLRKTDRVKINGVILTTDGCEAFFERVGDNFHKRYTGVTGLFDKIINSETFEDAQKVLAEQYLPRLVQMSPSRDDCGVSILVSPECVINERVIKEYPRPVIEERKVPTNTVVENVEEYEVEEDAIQYAGDIPLLTETEAIKILTAMKELCGYENFEYAELYEMYKTVMMAIADNGVYEINLDSIDDFMIMFLCLLDERLYWDEKNNIRRK